MYQVPPPKPTEDAHTVLARIKAMAVETAKTVPQRKLDDVEFSPVSFLAKLRAGQLNRKPGPAPLPTEVDTEDDEDTLDPYHFVGGLDEEGTNTNEEDN